jgi:DHA1 family tetracycline resistance protein-like MFS transporter
MINEKPLASMLPLFLVLFIDGMGLGLLFPILSGIVIDSNSHFLAASTSLEYRQILYGVIISIFMICWFFGSAILGDLSDTVGRKKALMICLIGSFLGYFLAAISIGLQSLTLLILGRIIAGFTAGSKPVAQAAIVDVSSEAHKVRNIGLILLAFSLGFVFGPILGGILSDPDIFYLFNYATPLYFAAILSAINAILLAVYFKETFYKTEKVRIRLHHAVNIFVSAFKHERIWHLSLIMLIMMFGWSNYFAFISLYMTSTYGFTVLGNSLFLAMMGLGFSIGCGYLIDALSKRYNLKKVTSISLMATAICVILIFIFHNLYAAWLFNLMIGISLSVAYSGIIGLFSNQVSDDEQGWVMGVTGSIMALCFGLTTFLTGFVIIYFGISSVLIMAFLGLGISGILLHRIKDSF